MLTLAKRAKRKNRQVNFIKEARRVAENFSRASNFIRGVDGGLVRKGRSFTSADSTENASFGANETVAEQFSLHRGNLVEDEPACHKVSLE